MIDTPATLDPISKDILALIGGQDPDVARILAAEAERQETTLELIASENHVSATVMHAIGTWMTNKYAEGYPGKRYYGGCTWHDSIEDLARDRAKELFNCGFANVQPHCGANANIAAFMALMKPGDTVLSLPIKSGGHLSHGLKPNFSGTYYKIVDYDLDPETELLDYDAIRSLARTCSPQVIICGYSAYSRLIDFAEFRSIADEVGDLKGLTKDQKRQLSELNQKYSALLTLYGEKVEMVEELQLDLADVKELLKAQTEEWAAKFTTKNEPEPSG